MDNEEMEQVLKHSFEDAYVSVEKKCMFKTPETIAAPIRSRLDIIQRAPKILAKRCPIA